VHRDETSPSVDDRRSDPRVGVDLPVVVRSGEHSCRGRTRDASAGGLLVELHEPLTFITQQVAVEITTAEGRTLAMEADVVRRAISTDGMVLLALRLIAGGGPRALRRLAGTRPRRNYGKRVQPSRAKPREPRSSQLAREELRALGVRALELTHDEPDGRAPLSFVRWARSLAKELGSVGPPATASNGDLVRSIVRLHRETAPA
jgi:hypothetical protein